MVEIFHCHGCIVHTSTDRVQLRWLPCNSASNLFSVLQLLTWLEDLTCIFSDISTPRAIISITYWIDPLGNSVKSKNSFCNSGWRQPLLTSLWKLVKIRFSVPWMKLSTLFWRPHLTGTVRTGRQILKVKLVENWQRSNWWKTGKGQTDGKLAKVKLVENWQRFNWWKASHKPRNNHQLPQRRFLHMNECHCYKGRVCLFTTISDHLLIQRNKSVGTANNFLFIWSNKN